MPALSIATSTIVAQAFDFMEVSPISSFGDDSDEARRTARAYPDALAACLAFADWSFASRMESLPEAVLPVTGGADPDLPYFYSLPDGLVAIRELMDDGGPVLWRRDSAGIYADASGPLRIRYTRLIEAEVTMPATFRIAVAYHLACLLAPRFGLTTTKLDRMEQLGQAKLMQAAQQDGRQASEARYDGEDEQGDWADMATQ